jgi:glutaredoxin-like protein
VTDGGEAVTNGPDERLGYAASFMLTPAERATVAGRVARLAGDVRLALYTRAVDCDTCAVTRALLEEVVTLSPRLSLEVHDLGEGAEVAVDRPPTIAVLGREGAGFVDHGIRLVGAPVGHELTSLVDAIVSVSSRDAGLTAESRGRLAALDRPVHVQVFSTPTCRYCPQAVSLAHRVALVSPLVTATAYSVIEFPDLIRRYRVTGVPKIVVDEGIELLGAQPEADFVDAIVRAHP